MVSRRWALFAVTVVVLGYGCYLLGRWQFHRLHDREVTNVQTRTNLKTRPAPVADVLSVGRPSLVRNEWRRVTATGSYTADKSVVIRYQTRDGASGVDVVTPLLTRVGTSLLVDRGWMSTSNLGGATVHPPTPPAGEVTVVGYVRADATGDAAKVTDRSARAVSSQAISRATGIRVYDGFVDAQKETPTSGKKLVPTELPDLGNGPHFFYGLQWWFFGLLAVFGFFYLAYTEHKLLRAGRGPTGTAPRGPPEESLDSKRAEHAAVDGEHRAADEARSG